VPAYAGTTETRRYDRTIEVEAARQSGELDDAAPADRAVTTNIAPPV
jgi:hypothetical protein